MGKNNKSSNEENNKLAAVKEAIAQINKDQGDGSAMFFDGNENTDHVGSIPTGSLLLDKALGIGGLPRGRITEIFGHEGSGKTTIALHTIANAQKRGGICAFIDVEHALDPSYAKQLGVDLSSLVIAQPDSGEKAFCIIEKLLSSKAVDVIVLDSVAAIIPKAEIEGSMDDHFMGGHARLMGKALRRITSEVSKSETACIFINQIRYKIGVLFGNPETTTGGNALKFFASVRLEVKKKSLIKKADDIVGQELEVKILKNKSAAPFQKVELELIYGKGINNLSELIDLCVLNNIINKSGTWFSYGDTKLGQGKDAACKFIASDEKLYHQLLESIGIKI